MLCSKILLMPCENLSMAFDVAVSAIAGIFTTYLGYVYGPQKVNAQDLYLRSLLILTCFYCLVFCLFVWGFFYILQWVMHTSEDGSFCPSLLCSAGFIFPLWIVHAWRCLQTNNNQHRFSCTEKILS